MIFSSDLNICVQIKGPGRRVFNFKGSKEKLSQSVKTNWIAV